VNNEYYRTSYFTRESWAVYDGTEHPELVKKFLAFIMQKEKVIELARQVTFIPTQPSAMRPFLLANIPAPAQVEQHPVSIHLSMFPIWNVNLTNKTLAAIGIPEMAREMQSRVDDYWTQREVI